MDSPSAGSHSPPSALARNRAARPAGVSAGGSAFDRGVLIADLPVRLFAEQQAAPEVAELFRPMTEHPGPYAAQIRVGRLAPPRPPRPADEVYGYLSLWRDDGVLVVQSGDTLRARATAEGAVVGGTFDGVPGGPTLLRAIFHHVLAHVLSLSGRLVVHGAAVGADPAGRDAGAGADLRGVPRPRAVLLLGGSGSGKSTTAYLASLAGWSLLSDDLVVTRRHTDRVGALGVHRALSVPGDVAAGGTVIDGDRRGRRRPSVVLDAREHDVVAVALVSHGEHDGSLERISGLEAAGAFTASAPAAGHLGVAGEVVRVAAVLATRPCFRLRTAAAAERRPAGTAALLDEVARVAGARG